MKITVERFLERSGISVQDLTSRCGLAAERVGAIVDGRWLASPVERQAIAAALGVAVEDIDWRHTINPRNVRYHRYGLPKDFDENRPQD